MKKENETEAYHIKHPAWWIGGTLLILIIELILAYRIENFDYTSIELILSVLFIALIIFFVKKGLAMEKIATKKENQIKKREEDIIEDRKREPKRRLKHLLLDPLAISYKVVQEKRVFDKDKIWGEVIPYTREEELLNTYKSQYDPDKDRELYWVLHGKPIHYNDVHRLSYAEMCMITRFEEFHPDLTVYHVIADKSTKALVDTTICTGLDEYKTVKKNFVTKIYALLYYKNDVSGYEGNANEWDEFHNKLDAGYAKAFLFEYGKMENGKFCDLEVLSNKHGLSFRNCIAPDVEDKENASYTDRMIVVKIKDELYRYIISDSCFRKLTDAEEQAYSEYLSTKTFYTLEETDKIYKIYEEEGVDDSLFKKIYGASNEGKIIEDIHNLIKIKMDIKYEYVPSIKYRNVNECSSVISRLTASCEVGYDEADYRVPRR